MTNLTELKFAECRECFFAHRRSTACRGCEAGENFEPHAPELDPDGDFDFINDEDTDGE